MRPIQFFLPILFSIVRLFFSNELRAQDSTYTDSVNGVFFTMVFVQGGSFTMGCTDKQMENCMDREFPDRRVTLSDYHIGQTEVTQALWSAVMQDTPSHFRRCPDCPVEMVSWYDAQNFIEKLNSLTEKKYRLPTEAEWEFAARGGNKSNNFRYSGGNKIDEVAAYNSGKWALGGSNQRTKAVKTLKPNELGIFDMSGNVWEWCQDWYGPYPSEDAENPKGPASGTNRVDRGGGWIGGERYSRISDRDHSTPTERFNTLGFRLAAD